MATAKYRKYAIKFFQGLFILTIIYLILVGVRTAVKGEKKGNFNIFSSEWWNWSKNTTPTSSDDKPPTDDKNPADGDKPPTDDKNPADGDTPPTDDKNSADGDTPPTDDDTPPTDGKNPAGNSSSTTQSDLSKQYTTKIKNFIDSIQSVHLHCINQRGPDVTAKYKEMLNTYVLQHYTTKGINNFDENALFCGKDRLGSHLPGKCMSTDANYPGWRNTVALGMKADFCSGYKGFYITLKNGKKIQHDWGTFLDMDKYTDNVLSEPPKSSTPTPASSTPTPPASTPTPPALTESSTTKEFFEGDGPLTFFGKTGISICGYWDDSKNYVNLGTCEGCCDIDKYNSTNLERRRHMDPNSNYDNRQYTTCLNQFKDEPLDNTRDFFTKKGCGTMYHKLNSANEPNKIIPIGWWDDKKRYEPIPSNIDLSQHHPLCQAGFDENYHRQLVVPDESKYGVQRGRKYAVCRARPNGSVLSDDQFQNSDTRKNVIKFEKEDVRFEKHKEAWKNWIVTDAPNKPNLSLEKIKENKNTLISKLFSDPQCKPDVAPNCWGFLSAYCNEKSNTAKPYGVDCNTIRN